jgi:hypothetical protein
MATLNTYIVDSYGYASNNKKGMYCSFSMATIITETLHNVKLYWSVLVSGDLEGI